MLYKSNIKTLWLMYFSFKAEGNNFFFRKVELRYISEVDCRFLHVPIKRQFKLLLTSLSSAEAAFSKQYKSLREKKVYSKKDICRLYLYTYTYVTNYPYTKEYFRSHDRPWKNFLTSPSFLSYNYIVFVHTRLYIYIYIYTFKTRI